MPDLAPRPQNFNYTFVMTREDLERYYAYTRDTSEAIKDRTRTRQYFLCGLIILFALYAGLCQDFLTFGIACAIALAIWLLTPMYIKDLYAQHHSQLLDRNASKLIEKRISLSFTEEHVRVEDSYSKTELQYAGIDKIIESVSHFFVMLSADQAIPLPKGKVSNTEEFSAFIQSQGVLLVRVL